MILCTPVPGNQQPKFTAGVLERIKKSLPCLKFKRTHVRKIYHAYQIICFKRGL